MSVPRVYQHGVLTKDPELRTDKTGKPYTILRLKTSDRKRDGQGTGWVDGPPTFLNVMVFGAMAANVTASLVGGDLVMAWGKLGMHEYTDDSGQRRTDYSVVADEIGVSLLFGEAPTRRKRGENGAEPVAAWK